MWGRAGRRRSEVATGRSLHRVVMGLACVAVAVAIPGCAARAPKPPASGGLATEPTILELQGKNVGYVRRIEELENRVYMLEDQLDRQKLAAEQKATPTLPARRLSASPPVASGGPPSEGPGGTPASLVDEQSVEYVGDAAEATERLPLSRAGMSARATSPARPRFRLTGPEPVGEGPSFPGGQDEGAPLHLYKDALEALRAGRHADALAGFQRFLRLYPQHDYADNAQFWSGECYYDSRQFAAAEGEFRRVIERYPDGNKVPDAMLKLGFTLHFLGDAPGSRAVLESLVRSFPKHEAAALASAQLTHPQADPMPTPTSLPVRAPAAAGPSVPPRLGRR